MPSPDPRVRAVWEPFLTERDRAHLGRTGGAAATGLGRRPALLLVDNYRLVFGDDRGPLLEGIADNPLYVGIEAWPAVEAQRALLGVARELGVPVVHTTGDVGQPGLGWTRSHAGLRGAPDRWTRPDPEDFRFLDELAPREGEFVVTKAAPSAFFGTPLPGLLHMLEVDTVIVCGESTSGCVRATAVDAASHRLRVTVPADCVYDRHEAAHAIALFDLATKYADVVLSADLVAALRDLR